MKVGEVEAESNGQTIRFNSWLRRWSTAIGFGLTYERSRFADEAMEDCYGSWKWCWRGW